MNLILAASDPGAELAAGVVGLVLAIAALTLAVLWIILPILLLTRLGKILAVLERVEWRLGNVQALLTPQEQAQEASPPARSLGP